MNEIPGVTGLQSRVEDVFSRWISSLRYKAGEYEHKRRRAGEDVTYPSLDDICNEMEAYLAGVKP